MKNITILTEKELTEIDGGTFAWDVGWFLGNGLVGNFNNSAGVADALADYWLHYSS